MFSRQPDQPVTDQDLHAFVDGELDGRRYRQVVQRLAVDPYAAERVNAILRQQGGFALLREQLTDGDPVADSQARDLARQLAGAVRHHRRVRLTSVASAVVLSLVVGSLGVWGPEPGAVAGRLGWPVARDDGPQVLFGRDQFVGTRVTAAQATDDVSASFDQQLAAYSVRRPDLAAHGLTFAGGDMLRGGQSPAVRLVYEDATGQQIFLFIGTVGDEDEVALTLVPEGHVSLNWRRGPLVFALIGPKESQELLEVMGSTSEFLVPVPELRPELPSTTAAPEALVPTDAVTAAPGQPGPDALLPSAPATQAPVPVAPESSAKTL